MAHKKQMWTGIIAAVVMAVMIFDAKTAFKGAAIGIDLCIRVVVPSLLPFVVISIIINTNLKGTHLRVLQPLGKLCGLPSGAESILALGLLGGYPIGAKAITDAYKSRTIKRNDAQRLLGFCNNAGPAFIFGILGDIFPKYITPWALWIIHITSALLTGCILKGKSKDRCNFAKKRPLTIPQALEQSVKTMTSICAWIIMFRVIICFIEKWFLWSLPQSLQAGIIGSLELSNGCYEMRGISNLGLRFILCSGILAFGGICVLMQTQSVTEELGLGMYFPGKILQTAISVILAIITQNFIFEESDQLSLSINQYRTYLAGGVFVTMALIFRKKVVAFLRHMVYNNRKHLLN